MNIPFSKYHGTGNDFILIDNREHTFPKENNNLIARLCHRRFGIGADGLILLDSHSDLDFEMIYYNSDGKVGSMCGNGGRCAVKFAKDINLVSNKVEFLAVDGLYKAVIQLEDVSLDMQPVLEIEKISTNTYFLNTGSPHVVKIVDSFPENFIEDAKTIRNSERFKTEGTNVNYIEIKDGHLSIRTFERGVEDETYSCGTGAVAAAIVYFLQTNQNNVKLQTIGGVLSVEAQKKGETFNSIKLRGKAIKVYEGNLDLK